MLFSCASAFVFVQQLHQHCIARCFPIHLPGMFLVNIFYLIWRCQNWKKTQIIDFLFKNLLKNAVFGSSERLHPLSAVPPTNKETPPPPPPISKPHPATKSFSTILFSCASALFFCFATATSTLHCLKFPHPPPNDVFWYICLISWITLMYYTVLYQIILY